MLVVIVLLLCWVMFDAGRKVNSFDKNGINHESDQLSYFNSRLKGENDKLRVQVAEF